MSSNKKSGKKTANHGYVAFVNGGIMKVGWLRPFHGSNVDTVQQDFEKFAESYGNSLSGKFVKVPVGTDEEKFDDFCKVLNDKRKFHDLFETTIQEGVAKLRDVSDSKTASTLTFGSEEDADKEVVKKTKPKSKTPAKKANKKEEKEDEEEGGEPEEGEEGEEGDEPEEGNEPEGEPEEGEEPEEVEDVEEAADDDEQGEEEQPKKSAKAPQKKSAKAPQKKAVQKKVATPAKVTKPKSSKAGK